MEIKKQVLRILSIGLMLAAIVSVHEVKSQQLTKAQLYRKCIAKRCNKAEKAQVRADFKRAGRMSSPLLFAAASAAIGAKRGLRRAGELVAAAEPAKIQLYRKCIARQCDEAEKAQVRADIERAKRVGKKVGLVAGGLLLAAWLATEVSAYRVEQSRQKARQAEAHERWLERDRQLLEERQRAQLRVQKPKRPRRVPEPPVMRPYPAVTKETPPVKWERIGEPSEA